MWSFLTLQKCVTLSVSMACVKHRGVLVRLDGAVHCATSLSATNGALLTATATTAPASVNQAGMDAIVLSVCILLRLGCF